MFIYILDNFELETCVNSFFFLILIFHTQLVICQNKVEDLETLKETMIHELTHAYDYCRVELDSNNCTQFACSEVILAKLILQFEACVREIALR